MKKIIIVSSLLILSLLIISGCSTGEAFFRGSTADPRLDRGDLQIQQPEQDKIAEALCIKNGCYDTDPLGAGGSLNYDKAGTTYFRIKENKSCQSWNDYCKDEYLIEQYCAGESPNKYADSGRTKCECGCSAGACNPVYNYNGTPTCNAQDLCPDTAGIQGNYLYDNNGDGIKDSCTQVDLCPTITGIQAQFLYDNDGDGTPESCFTPEQVCAQFNPNNPPENVQVGSHEGLTVYRFCTAEGKPNVMNVFCGSQGAVDSDITQCNLGMPCFNATCAVCYDPDGKDFESKSYVQVLSNGNLMTANDHCESGGISNPFGRRLDFTCSPYGSYALNSLDCDPGKICQSVIADGTQKLQCINSPFTPTCSDFDGKNNFQQVGYVQGININGDFYTQNDACETSSSAGSLIVDYYCSESAGFSVPSSSTQACPIGQTCVKDAVAGTFSCVPSQQVGQCVDTDGFSFDNKGTVTVTKPNGEVNVYTDTCSIGENGLETIIDHYCTPNKEDAIQTNPCNPNEKCVESTAESGSTSLSCVKQCVDYDEANDPNVAGIVYDENGQTQPDFCDGNLVRQYGCQDNQLIDITPVECPNGCNAGKCI